ncbi:hypothetical protein KPC83_04515 [Collinsella sp. zg1085]|uniref:flavodoxin domain-containing protein n=1 Tax=Collinsella sp. zg1085 TaxID=2844380 RepID=UPI001C0C4F1D|nr:flavodoxin domain-containing protein [Collinsella sp. zg1085]QWT17114.1 hypothetical protein KPC83_04515 [Collinsella sp. zg1085]
MKTIILYRSRHHGNTKKVVDALAAAFPDIDTLDIATLGKHEVPDVSSYHLIGAASGIYYGGFDAGLKRVLEQCLSYGDKVFGLMTYGGNEKWHGRDLAGVCQVKMATVLTMFGCQGYDSWGPFKLVGGIGKGHPNQDDLDAAIAFYARLEEEYGQILEDEWNKREHQRAIDAQAPKGGLLSMVKRTVRGLGKSSSRDA